MKRPNGQPKKKAGSNPGLQHMSFLLQLDQRRLAATKSQFTNAQNDSTYFGRALR